MSELLRIVIDLAMFVHLALALVCCVRVWRSKNIVDRILGLDMLGVLFGSLLLLAAFRESNPLYIDLSVGVIVLGFIGTIVWMKYLANQKEKTRDDA